MLLVGGLGLVLQGGVSDEDAPGLVHESAATAALERAAAAVEAHDTHRLDVLAEMARLELLHEQTKVCIFGTGAVDDARHALREARRAFRRRKQREP